MLTDATWTSVYTLVGLGIIGLLVWAVWKS